MNYPTSERTLLDAIDRNNRTGRNVLVVAIVTLFLALGVLISFASNTKERQTAIETKIQLQNVAIVNILDYLTADNPDPDIKPLLEKISKELSEERNAPNRARIRQ